MINKKLILALFSLSLGAVAQTFAQEEDKEHNFATAHITTRGAELDETVADETKKPLRLEAGDCALTFGGATKIEHFFMRNQVLLNKNLPDEANFFKHTLDLSFDFAYGEKKFDHKALELFTNIRYKGIWGKGSVFSDSNDGTLPANVMLSNTAFGSHSHSSGKPLLWVNQGWLQFSFNALFNSPYPSRHFMRLGWFPFELGRGIALGGFYGLGREILSFFSYGEDKSAPGIMLSGEIIKDVLAYDIYYAKFQSRSKSGTDTFNNVKEQLVGRKLTPWRGVGKDNDLIAGRLKWKAMDSDQYGKLAIEPYAFYNAASDQKTNVPADTRIQFGSVGLGVEHTIGGFEIGAEAAMNYGNELVRSSDINTITIKRDDTNGYLREQFTNIIDMTTGKPAFVNPDSLKAAAIDVTSDADPLTGNGVVGQYRSSDSGNKNGEKDRITPAYRNNLRGWMFVTDLAYTFQDADFMIAGAYGFASGDNNPNENSVNKTYKGFIGLHECYAGKRVPSVILLDERNLRIPVPLSENTESKAEEDFAFSDLQHVGLGLTWSPKLASKQCSFNANALAFWKTHTGKKWDTTLNVNAATGIAAGGVSTEDANRFMGTEYNLFVECELLKNFKMYGIFAAFAPGTYFNDVSGVPLDKDFYLAFAPKFPEAELDPTNFRLSNNAAYHVNIGFEYKF